jgi:large subunit ribosomal protein L25
MAQAAELAVSSRPLTGKAIKRLRRAGLIPANISGHGEPAQAVQLEAQAFELLRRGHHATGMIALLLDGAPQAQTALIRHVQRDPLSDKILHIDFLRVSLRDRITAKVVLRFGGNAPGVKVEGGTLLHLLDALEVTCAAGDIVESLEVDISSLAHIDDILHARDVTLPANFTLMTDPEEPIVKIAPPRIEKVEVPAEATSADAAASEAATAPGDGNKA